MEEKDKLRDLYDENAESFLLTRTKEKGIVGFFNREIEQPLMYGLVPKDLKGKKLLDVGCGPGIHLKRYIDEGAIGEGIDFSQKMIELAKEHCPKGKFNVGEVYNLPYEDNSFDIITSSLVFDHLEDLDKAVKQVAKILKPNGVLIFSVMHPISNMYRESEENTPSHSYFDKEVIYYDIACGGKKFVDYPRTIQEYLDILLDNGFVLEKFVENEPKESWKKQYPDITPLVYKIPYMCWFKVRLKK